MKDLAGLLKKLKYECINGNEHILIDKVIYDSRKVSKNSLFICIKGVVTDSHAYVEEVIAAGASAIVVQEDISVPSHITVIKVESTRYAMAHISAAFFDFPAEKLRVIGITGTKGKTTTTYMIKSILESIGYKVGLIGTIETIIGERSIPAGNTTPESYVLQETFHKMVEEKCQIVVMEVSSQGLMLHRTAGILFEIGILTNIAPDHIGPGEHESFEEYKICKGMLFTQCKLGIVNIDDSNTKDVLVNHTCQIETIGFSEKADFRASDTKLLKEAGCLGVIYKVSGRVNFEVKVNIPGKFSVYNSLTAIAVCSHFNVPADNVYRALQKARVKGRIELIKVSDDFSLMIDYAHNAMSLESLLLTLREYNPKRLVALFGCGGNRSKLRRYEMGEVSGRLADLTIITSDNPRDEEPQEIIEDIKQGIAKTEGTYIEIIDRREAITYVIEHGEPGDIIVLAGKGHEDYQEISGKKYPMDERDIISDIIGGKYPLTKTS